MLNHFDECFGEPDPVEFKQQKNEQSVGKEDTKGTTTNKNA